MLPRAIPLSTRFPRGSGLARIALGICLFSIIGFRPRTFADGPPKFADPEVTAYVQVLAQFCDRYLRTARRGDRPELKRMDAEFPALQEKAVRLLDKLEPSETKRFTEFVTSCGQTMMDASFGLSQPHTG